MTPDSRNPGKPQPSKKTPHKASFSSTARRFRFQYDLFYGNFKIFTFPDIQFHIDQGHGDLIGPGGFEYMVDIRAI